MERKEALAVLAKVRKVYVRLDSGHVKATKESVKALIQGAHWNHKLSVLKGMREYCAILENVD